MAATGFGKRFGERLGGGWRDNPFFEAGTVAPVRSVHVLASAEWTRACAAAQQPAG